MPCAIVIPMTQLNKDRLVTASVFLLPWLFCFMLGPAKEVLTVFALAMVVSFVVPLVFFGLVWLFD